MISEFVLARILRGGCRNFVSLKTFFFYKRCILYPPKRYNYMLLAMVICPYAVDGNSLAKSIFNVYSFGVILLARDYEQEERTEGSVTQITTITF